MNAFTTELRVHGTIHTRPHTHTRTGTSAHLRNYQVGYSRTECERHLLERGLQVGLRCAPARRRVGIDAHFDTAREQVSAVRERTAGLRATTKAALWRRQRLWRRGILKGSMLEEASGQTKTHRDNADGRLDESEATQPALRSVDDAGRRGQLGHGDDGRDT
jgi:hypothetical protein